MDLLCELSVKREDSVVWEGIFGVEIEGGKS